MKYDCCVSFVVAILSQLVIYFLNIDFNKKGCQLWQPFLLFDVLNNTQLLFKILNVNRIDIVDLFARF